MASAEGVDGGAYMIDAVVVKRGESLEYGSEGHGWGRDFGFGRRQCQISGTPEGKLEWRRSLLRMCKFDCSRLTAFGHLLARG